MHDFFRWKYWNPKRLYNVKDIRLLIPFSWACAQSSSFLFSLLTLNVNIHNMVAILIFVKEFKYSPIECVFVCMHACTRLTKRRKKQRVILVLKLYSSVEPMKHNSCYSYLLSFVLVIGLICSWIKRILWKWCCAGWGWRPFIYDFISEHLR